MKTTTPTGPFGIDDPDDRPTLPGARPRLPDELEPGPLLLALLNLTGDRSHDDPIEPADADAHMLRARQTGWDDLSDRLKVRCKQAIGRRVDPDHMRVVLGGVDYRTKTWKLPVAEAGDVGGVDPLAGLITLDAIGNAEPAERVARGLFWKSKLGVLHGGSGSGKTTLTAGVLSALTAGSRWMGHETVEGGCHVLVLSGEDCDTILARVSQWGGDPKRITVWPEPSIAALPEAIERTGAAAVVVDSLQSLARGMGLDLNGDADAGTLVRGMSKAARSTGASVLILHHEPWAQGAAKGASDGGTIGRAKGSGEIVAAADYCLRCETDELRGETTITPTKRRFGIDVERLVFLLDPDTGHTPAPDDGDGGGGGGFDPERLERLRVLLTGEAQTQRSIMKAGNLGSSETSRRRFSADMLTLLERGEAVRGKVLLPNGNRVSGYARRCAPVCAPGESAHESGACAPCEPCALPPEGGHGDNGAHAGAADGEVDPARGERTQQGGESKMGEVVDGPWGGDVPTVDEVQALADVEPNVEDWVGELPAALAKWTAEDTERFRWAQRVQSSAPEGQRVQLDAPRPGCRRVFG